MRVGDTSTTTPHRVVPWLWVVSKAQLVVRGAGLAAAGGFEAAEWLLAWTPPAPPCPSAPSPAPPTPPAHQPRKLG